MKHKLNKIFDFFGFHILRNKEYLVITPTSICKVNSLIKRLKPYKTDKALVRLGPKGDGGYLILEDLDGIKYCFSPGVDTISEFQVDCINLGMKVCMADKSVERPNISISPSKYDFIKKHIGSSNNLEFITLDE